MAGISSKAAGRLENKRKYNGIEFDEDLDIESYEAFYRNLDPQTGRWWQIDPRCEPNEDSDEIGLESLSPYNSMANNPIELIDPLGDWPDWFAKASEVVGDAVAGGAQGLLGAVNAFASNNLGGVGRVDGSNLTSAFQIGQKIGDVASVITGTAEMVLGGGSAVLTGGGSASVSVPVTLHGAATTVVALKNVVFSNSTSNNSTSNAQSSTKPRNAPQQTGTPNSSKIEAKDANGKTTKYSTYGSDGKIKKQVQVDKGSTRHGTSGATKKVPNFNTNPNTGQKHINGYKIKKALPAETPPGSH